MYLAHRLEAAFKSFSADKDCICRVLGCIARWECVKVRDAYDRAGFGRTLVQAVKTIITQRNYQSAILLLIEGDMLLTPLGSDREAIEDEADAAKEGVRVGKVCVYMPSLVRSFDVCLFCHRWRRKAIGSTGPSIRASNS